MFAGLQTTDYVPPDQTPAEKEWQQVGKQSPLLQRQLVAAAAGSQDGLQSESSDDFGGPQSMGSMNSNSPLLARLVESTSLSRGQLVEELGSTLTAAALAAHTDQMAGLEQGTGLAAMDDPNQAAPTLADIRTSSSHALPPPRSTAEEAVQRRKHHPGSTRFALDASEMGKASSTKSRLGQSALKRSNTRSPSGRSKSLRRVLVTAPDDDDEDVSVAQISLEIQHAAPREADDQAWPMSERLPKANRLVPTKSSLKSPASGRKKLGVSSTRFSSLRFSTEPQHHVIAVTPQDSMGSDHSTLSASFKSFRSIPSRLSQFGSQHSLRWTLAADQSVEFWSYCKRRFITTAVVLAYFMYPDMSENIANIFSCYPIQFGTYSNGYTSSVRHHADMLFVLWYHDKCCQPRVDACSLVAQLDCQKCCFSACLVLRLFGAACREQFTTGLRIPHRSAFLETISGRLCCWGRQACSLCALVYQLGLLECCTEAGMTWTTCPSKEHMVFSIKATSKLFLLVLSLTS